jgi:hypothetical protein
VLELIADGGQQLDQALGPLAIAPPDHGCDRRREDLNDRVADLLAVVLQEVAEAFGCAFGNLAGQVLDVDRFVLPEAVQDECAASDAVVGVLEIGGEEGRGLPRVAEQEQLATVARLSARLVIG